MNGLRVVMRWFATLFLLGTVPASWSSVNPAGPEPSAQLSSKISFEGEGTLRTGPGIPISTLIEIWPRNIAGEMDKKDWEGAFLGDFLFVFKVESLGYSINNPDVLQIRAVVVFLKNVEGYPSLEFLYKGRKVSTFLYKIGLGKEAPFDLDGNFSILEESFKDEAWWDEWRGPLGRIFQGLLCILSVALLPFLYRRWSALQVKRKMQKERMRKLEHFSHELGAATSRPDFERIFAQKGEWMGFLAKGDPSMIKFLSLVELNQYKKEWSEWELREIQESSRRLKGLMAVR